MNLIHRSAELMVAKIGFGGAPVMTPGQKCGWIAMVSASLLTLAAVSCVSLGVWRVGVDLDWTGDFVIQKGFLSHWQVWIGAAVGTQYASSWLARYAGILRRRRVAIIPEA